MTENYSAEGLFSFLNAGVSPFHAVAAAEELLLAQGAVSLDETEQWTLKAGGLYYTKRNGSSMVAFRLPANELLAYRIAASHSDAPTWRIKTLGGSDKYYAKAEVEGYGGMIMSSWMDRPLTLAGRVMVKTKWDDTGLVKINSVLVHPQKALLCIPSVAIHFNRTINTGYAYNPQVDLQPIFGAAGDSLEDTLKAELNLPADAEIIGHDLVLCPLQEAVALGVNGADFMSPRIDDLECAYTTLAAFLNAASCPADKDNCHAWVMFDNEEVGSSSRQGASGSLLPDVLSRIEEFFGLGAEGSVIARTNSLLVSADNGHAVHPNHPEKSDPEHPVTLGGGIVLKYNASQKYTTNAFTAAIFTEICKLAGVQTQAFYNRADMPGGSTLGNLLSHSISMPMLDIGLAQLAMHASVETANLADAAQMAAAVTALYRASFLANAADTDDSWVLNARYSG